MFLLFEFGSVFFWLFIVVMSGIIIAILENSNSAGGWSTFIVIASFVALYYLGAKVTLSALLIHVIHNPLETIAYFAIYVMSGIVWSFLEWRWYVDEKVTGYKEALRNNVEKGWSKPKPEDYMPQVAKNKSRLFTWVFYWPWSVLWFMAHKPIETLYKEILKVTTKVYERITKSAFDKVKR